MSSEVNIGNLDQADLSDAFREELANLEIPRSIDPKLFLLWLERENAAFEKQLHEHDVAERTIFKPRGSLVPILGAFLGIMAMIVTILLGIVQENETNEILTLACKVFLCYTIIGCFAGWIAERCIRDSVETMLREIVRRTNGEQQQAPSVSAGE